MLKIKFQKFYLNELRTCAKSHLNKSPFHQDNFKVFYVFFLFSLASLTLTSLIYKKLTLNNLTSISIFLLFSLISFGFIAYTLFFLKLVNNSFHLVKEKGQLSIDHIDEKIKELDKERIIQEKNYLEKNMKEINSNPPNKTKI